ncbi:MAG: FkbM family methyltransferase [Pseudomonadota bacterium]
MKTKIINSALGQALLSVHRDWGLRILSTHNPEQAGTIANGIIADRLIAQICPKGGIFLDIGAQYGAVFSAARKRDPSLQVYAFEADGQKAEALKAAHPYAQIFGVAVGEQEGEATFYVNPVASGYNSLVPAKDRQEVRVRLAAVDDLLPDISPDVIKIDIEGAELGAFRGAEQTIARGKPTIMFECILPKENALGYSAGDIWDWFAAREYSISTPDRVAHDAPGLSKDTFCDAQLYPFRSHNYFAIAAARRREVRDRARSILKVESRT